MRKTISLAFFLIFLIPSVMADSLSFSFFQNQTNNLYQNISGESDFLSNLSIYIDKDLEPFSLFTQGNYSYLFKNPSLSYYVQNLGLDYLYPLNEKSALYFSLTGKGTFFRSDFRDFNYFSMNFLAAFKTYLSPTSILKSNYTLEYKDYTSSFFDFLSHAVLISVDKYFSTKTTVKAEMNWGYKYFLHPFLLEQIAPGDAEPFVNRGNGKGQHAGGTSSQFITQTDGQGQGLQVISLGGLIAQGLGSAVGLRLSGMKQWTLSGENPFTFIEEFYSVENPSYDQFSWEGYQINSQLTVLIPWNIQMKIGYTLMDKKFPGIESLSLEGDSLGISRKDVRKQIELRAEKNFPKMTVYLSYYHLNNRSNDPFFQWKGQFFSAGIDWSLNIREKE